mmetsp:Transcript_6776/g.27632  ORF Transcript_6776/g.27632 Transcript_6776/m.27632 type:complete len:202 (-) Transcript_6776:820-1425(-)
MWCSATPRAAPRARSHSSVHSASSGARDSRYHSRSSKTTCGCDCTPFVFVASLTHEEIFFKISAASLEPRASSAEARGVLLDAPNTASRMKNGSFQRNPSPARDFEKSSGTRRPKGQCSSERSGCKIRSTSSSTSTPELWNSLTISAATAPSLRNSKISPALSPPASATRSERLRNSVAPSKSRPRLPMCDSTAAPSTRAT